MMTNTARHRLKLIYTVLSLFFSTKVWAWNAFGHFLIAQIAYDQLTPAERIFFQHDNQGFSSHDKYEDLIQSSIWLDKLRAVKWNHQVKPLGKLHYIGLPYSPDYITRSRVSKMNAVVAVKMAKKILSDSNVDKVDRTISLRILWHVVGDIHQPMHCIKYINANYPRSDKGGNLYRLGPNLLSKNLHGYWDVGGGALVRHKKSLRQDIKHVATMLEKRWPCQKSMDLDPKNWAQESYQLAAGFAYQTPEYIIPSEEYHKKTQSISEERIALAGCRLAAMSKQIYQARKILT